MELKGSKTEANLKQAFAGESQARVKYEFFAGVAKKEEYDLIRGVFQETSDNEFEHAEKWFKLLNGGKMPKTSENLQIAAEGERYEHDVMYKEMAETAREEGFDQIAELFEKVGAIEDRHAKRYMQLKKELDEDLMFEGEEGTIWICRKCGNMYVGENPPETCPVCGHTGTFYEKANNELGL